jgi:hypothetical protein
VQHREAQQVLPRAMTSRRTLSSVSTAFSLSSSTARSGVVTSRSDTASAQVRRSLTTV